MEINGDDQTAENDAFGKINRQKEQAEYAWKQQQHPIRARDEF